MTGSKRQAPFKMLKMFLHLFMALIYVAVGVLTITYNWFAIELEQPVAIILGVLLISYGSFRAYRGYKNYIEE